MGIEVKTIVRLSDRETRFVEGLSRGLKPTRAATAAGYSIAQARHLLAKTHVACAIRTITANMIAATARCDALALASD